MRSRVSWTVGLVVAGFVAGCQPQQPAELSPQDVAAVKAISGTWTKAQMAGDWATMETLFADKSALYPPNMAPVEGKEATMAFLKAFPKLTAFTATSVEVSGHGDIAVDRGTFEFTTAAAPNAPVMTDKGTYLAIEQKQADGSWKVVKDIWHSDLPLPAPAATPAKKE